MTTTAAATTTTTHELAQGHTKRDNVRHFYVAFVASMMMPFVVIFIFV